MSKKSKIELTRATDLTEIDAELDDALAKLEATSSKVDEVLAAETGAPGAAGNARPKSSRIDAEDGESEEE